MFGYCDACEHARSITVASNGSMSLDLCGHHTNKHATELLSQGWELVSIDQPAGEAVWPDGWEATDTPIYADIERSFEPGGENYSG